MRRGREPATLPRNAVVQDGASLTRYSTKLVPNTEPYSTSSKEATSVLDLLAGSTAVDLFQKLIAFRFNGLPCTFSRTEVLRKR